MLHVCTKYKIYNRQYLKYNQIDKKNSQAFTCLRYHIDNTGMVFIHQGCGSEIRIVFDE